jgi:predicted Zn-dependent protease
MEYENPPIEEGINYSSEHPLKEFLQLLLGVSMLVIVSIVVINLLIGILAKQIPFEFEQKMAESVNLIELLGEEGLDGNLYNSSAKSLEPALLSDELRLKVARKQYLQLIADKISPAMNLPEGMQLTLHYSDSDQVNAFATLGGHIVFFEGLLAKLGSEDELAAVMAHELAHVKLRHPIVAIGKGLTMATLAASISGASGSSAGNWLISRSANLSLLKFSRDQEAAADAESAAALVSIYGHIGGAYALFQHFAEIEGASEDQFAVAEIFRSHPYSEVRWLALKKLALQQGWLTQGPTLPLQLPQRVLSESE